MSIDQNSIINAAARAAYEANRAYCLALGDTSHSTWEDAPEWQKSSCMAGVRGVLAHGYTPREYHGAWLADKKAGGWVYGPVKDPVKKEHPCMVPYDELPEDQRRKDDIFVTVVRVMVNSLMPTRKF